MPLARSESRSADAASGPATSTCCDGLHLRQVRGEQADQRVVDDDDLVLGVVGDVDELLGEQPDVERVQHRAHRGDRRGRPRGARRCSTGRCATRWSPSMPSERRPLASLRGPLAELGVGLAAAAVGRGGDHLGVGVHRGAVLHQRADGERDVLHGAAHRGGLRAVAVCPEPVAPTQAISRPWSPSLGRMRPRRLRRLTGLNVFVTGAASGIGRATAEAVAAGGGRLFLTDIDADGLATTAADASGTVGGEVVLAEAVDLTDHDGVRRLARRVTDEHGAMDVVMNIAGISAWGTVSSLEHATWRRQVEVNLMGPIHVIEELVPPMVEAGRGGHLVNVVVGGRDHRDAVARGVQRQQVRPPRGLRGAPLRPRPARHRRLAWSVPGAVHTPLTEHGPDRRRRHRPARASARCRRASTSGRSRRRRRPRRSSRAYGATATGSTPPPTSGMIHLVQRLLPAGVRPRHGVLNRGANRVLPEVGQARRAER